MNKEIKKNNESCSENGARKLSIPCEVYTRVTGFYRPVSHFNPGKREEFRNRKYLSLERMKTEAEGRR